jgi:hypothetical protein
MPRWCTEKAMALKLGQPEYSNVCIGTQGRCEVVHKPMHCMTCFALWSRCLYGLSDLLLISHLVWVQVIWIGCVIALAWTYMVLSMVLAVAVWSETRLLWGWGEASFVVSTHVTAPVSILPQLPPMTFVLISNNLSFSTPTVHTLGATSMAHVSRTPGTEVLPAIFPHNYPKANPIGPRLECTIDGRFRHAPTLTYLYIIRIQRTNG